MFFLKKNSRQRKMQWKRWQVWRSSSLLTWSCSSYSPLRCQECWFPTEWRKSGWLDLIYIIHNTLNINSEKSRIQLCICGIKSAMLIIGVSHSRVSCGITPNIIIFMTPTASIMVRRTPVWQAFYFFFPALIFPKISTGSSARWWQKQLRLPVQKGISSPYCFQHIDHNFKISTNTCTSGAVKMISSRIFFIDSLLKSIIFLHFFLISCESTSATITYRGSTGGGQYRQG